jgi:hypothetical protein
LLAIVLKTTISKTHYILDKEVRNTEFADSVLGYFLKFYLPLDAGKKPPKWRLSLRAYLGP